MSKRLLICTPSHALHGGVERIVESLALQLPSRGFEVVVGLAKGNRFNDPDRYRQEYPRLTTVDIDGTSGHSTDRIRALMEVIDNVDPDVLLIARLFDAYPATALMKQRGHRVRLALTVQAFEHEYVVDAASFAPFVDVCVTSGELIAEALRRFTSIPSDRVISIPGGVAPAYRLRTPRPGPLRIGYVGRVETQQKRILDLVDVLAELRRRDVPFTCVVAGDGSAMPELRDRLDSAALGNAVTLAGWLSTEELYEKVYPDLDVIVHFAEWEGVTIAPREAMAHGVVPVISRFTGLSTEGQFVDGENALVFPVGDIAAAADRINRLDRDRSLLERLSSAASGSQKGIRSEEGAADAWATAFALALSSPSRLETQAVQLPQPSGRLSFLSPDLASFLRRVMGRRMVHNDPGSEWPHWSGRSDPSLEAELREMARSAR